MNLMDERDFYDERPETRKHTLNCPHCHQSAEYDIGWFVRSGFRFYRKHGWKWL